MADSFLFGIIPFIDNMSKKQVGKQPIVKKIDKNGKYNVQDVEIVKVEVPGGTGPAPTGTKKIIANGNGIDVAKFAKVDVNVPTGITPSGTKQITENGEGIDVAEFATVNVNVAGKVPTGNKPITTTEQVDVSDFATAQVQDANLSAANIKKDVSILGITGSLESYPEPSGAYDIYYNGEYDIKNYATVNVQLSTGEHLDNDSLLTILAERYYQYDPRHANSVGYGRLIADSDHNSWHIDDNAGSINFDSKSTSISPCCDLNLLDGGHDYGDAVEAWQKFIVLGILDSNIESSDSRPFYIDVSLRFYSYSGGEDPEEVANYIRTEWESMADYTTKIPVYDLSGKQLGIVSGINASIEVTSDC